MCSPDAAASNLDAVAFQIERLVSPCGFHIGLAYGHGDTMKPTLVGSHNSIGENPCVGVFGRRHKIVVGWVAGTAQPSLTHAVLSSVSFH